MSMIFELKQVIKQVQTDLCFRATVLCFTFDEVLKAFGRKIFKVPIEFDLLLQ